MAPRSASTVCNGEALARDFVPGGRQVDLHETERPARLRFGRATRIFNWSRFGQLRRMALSFGKSLKPNERVGIGNRPLLCRSEGQADYQSAAS
jgi:hypothetical protein